MARASLLALLGAACAVLAQTPTYSESAVPTGTPIPGNYTGGLRPQIHYSPPKNFMNDPNGMFVDVDGVWHLYYQYDATGIVAGNQHWGHATSKDLYHWINQPIALYPLNASCYIFSGSAVIDTNNTSGFFPKQNNGVVAIYTIATYSPILLQTQGIAYSYDNGYTFTPYSKNPVLDIGSSQFRDPKVIRYGDHWVMIISYASDFTIGFYTSKNLKQWTHASNFTHHGLLGIQYECPNLVEMPVEGGGTKWVLQISINPGAPLGGSISQFFPGTFDGITFKADDAAARINDFGKDNYAGQFFYNVPAGQDAVSIAWASNWEYSQTVPTGPIEGWRSAMSLPRRNRLRRINGDGPAGDWRLISEPYDMSPVMGKQLASQTLGNGSFAVDFSSVESNAIYVEAKVSTTMAMGGTVNFTIMSPVSGEFVVGGAYLGSQQAFFVNRGGVRGFDNVFFTNSFSGHPLTNTSSYSFVFDRSIIEMFINGGEESSTTTFFPEQPLTVLSVGVAGLLPNNQTVTVDVYGLNSAWAQYENASGTVVGNVTTSGAGSNSTKSRRHFRYEADF